MVAKKFSLTGLTISSDGVKTLIQHLQKVADSKSVLSEIVNIVRSEKASVTTSQHITAAIVKLQEIDSRKIVVNDEDFVEIVNFEYFPVFKYDPVMKKFVYISRGSGMSIADSFSLLIYYLVIRSY
jgi:hypothetical protein